MKKIGIIHFRIGLTDGVSLEINKRKKILERMGNKVITIGGKESKKADYYIKGLDFDSVISRYWRNKFFDTESKTKYKKRVFNKDIEYIEKQLEEVFLKENFDIVFIHNLFSLAAHPTATLATKNIIKKNPQIKFILVNHDYYWERNYSRKPKSLKASKFCEENLPIEGKNVINCSINKSAQKELLRFKNIQSLVIGDTFDFKKKHFNKKTLKEYKELRKKLNIKEEDIVFLQATRIVPRKAIELSIDFIAELNKQKEDVFKNYKNILGKKSNKNSQLYLVFSNFVEKSEKKYLELLKKHATEKKVTLLFARTKEINKKYDFWDFYNIADFVTYPSIKEGWGNQFLELVAARKLGIIFEYPVFSSDIKPLRTKQVILAKKYNRDKKDKRVKVDKQDMEKAVKQFKRYIKDPQNLKKTLDNNLKIVRKHHDLAALERHLKKIVN